jgi:hypothetical protein
MSNYHDDYVLATLNDYGRALFEDLLELLKPMPRSIVARWQSLIYDSIKLWLVGRDPEVQNYYAEAKAFVNGGEKATESWQVPLLKLTDEIAAKRLEQ